MNRPLERYGAPPVTRAVGGIMDAVDDAGVVNGDKVAGTGFLFDRAAPDDMVSSLLRATSLYQNSAAWKCPQRRAMVRNVAWEQSAQQYLELYDSVLGVITPDERLSAPDNPAIAPCAQCELIQVGG